MALYGPRVTIAVELAGTWGKFGGFGSRVCQLVERLVARARDHIEVMALAHPARVITKPGRDRNARRTAPRDEMDLRAIDERRRACNGWKSSFEAFSTPRNGPA